jgi:hypothetical protein
MLDIGVIDDPATASVALDPVRSRLLSELVNRHLRLLLRSGPIAPAAYVDLLERRNAMTADANSGFLSVVM